MTSACTSASTRPWVPHCPQTHPTATPSAAASRISCLSMAACTPQQTAKPSLPFTGSDPWTASPWTFWERTSSQRSLWCNEIGALPYRETAHCGNIYLINTCDVTLVLAGDGELLWVALLFSSVSVSGVTSADLATGQINWRVALNTGVGSVCLSEQKMEVACTLGSDTTNKNQKTMDQNWCWASKANCV